MSRKITRIQRRFILDNPHVQSGKLALLLDINAGTIKQFRRRKKLQANWTYTAKGIPFMRFDGTYRVQYKGKSLFWSKCLENSIKAVDHLIWCIQSKMFNAKPIEHPYLENLKFTGEIK